MKKLLIAELTLRKWFYLILAVIFIGLAYERTVPVKMTPGERFIGKRGGRIEISLIEGDPLDPIVFKAASSSFFRLKDGEYNVLPYLESRPLGYMEDELFYYTKWHNAKESWNWKIVEGKGKIEFEIFSEVSEDQEISITYVKPLWSKIGVYLLFFIYWLVAIFVVGSIF